jgi:hypothetical protein
MVTCIARLLERQRLERSDVGLDIGLFLSQRLPFRRAASTICSASSRMLLEACSKKRIDPLDGGMLFADAFQQIGALGKKLGARVRTCRSSEMCGIPGSRRIPSRRPALHAAAGR